MKRSMVRLLVCRGTVKFGRGPEGGVIILAMKYFQSRKSRLCMAVVATFVFAVLLAEVVSGQANDAASSGQDRIEVVSPAGVATAEGELRVTR